MAKGFKTGGRKRGTPNKLTKEIRERFCYLVDNNLDRLQDDLDALEPIDRIRMIISLSKFILPNLKQIDLELQTEERNVQPVEIIFTQAKNED